MTDELIARLPDEGDELGDHRLCEQLLFFLNVEKTGKKSRREVEWDRLKDVFRELVADMKFVEAHLSEREQHLEDDAYYHTLHQAKRRIDSKLWNYHSNLELQTEYFTGGGKANPRRQFIIGNSIVQHTDGTSSSMVEDLALRQLMQLVYEARFHLLRKCFCGRWFLAARRNSVACSPEHRREGYEKSDAYRKIRADYMRKRRDPSRRSVEKSNLISLTTTKRNRSSNVKS